MTPVCPFPESQMQSIADCPGRWCWLISAEIFEPLVWGSGGGVGGGVPISGKNQLVKWDPRVPPPQLPTPNTDSQILVREPLQDRIKQTEFTVGHRLQA